MTRVIDLAGQKFSRLTVVRRAENSKNGQARWYCKCECGNEVLRVVGSHDLKSGHTRSCGCLITESVIKRSFVHGHSPRGKQSLTFMSWNNMITRCTNPNYVNKHRYEGRNIAVANEWFNFESFLKDMGERPSRKHTLDRIDNDKGYFKENCRWVTCKEQSRNRSLDHRNKSGAHGIYTYRDGRRYVAVIGVDGKQKHLGLFETLEEAISARKEAEIQYWGKSS